MNVPTVIPTLMLTIIMTVFCDPIWAEKCQTIRFRHGESSTTVKGITTPDDVKCYLTTTGQGQTAKLRVMSGNNIIFSIEGVVDAQDSYTFTTERKTYRIRVGQMMRSIADEPFSLFVSIE